MLIKLGSKLEIENPTPEVRKFILDELTVENPEYLKRKLLRLPVWGIDAKIKLYMQLNTPIGPVFTTGRGFIYKLHRKFGAQVIKVVDNTIPGIHVDFGYWNPNVIMRAYQEDALAAVGRGSGLLVIPAGGGKTITALRYAYVQARPTLWLVHTKHLATQVADIIPTLFSNPGKLGQYYDSVVEHGDGKFAIALFQTLQNNGELCNFLAEHYATVIVDEVHHVASEYFGSIVAKFKPKCLLGMTATIERKDRMECIIENYIGEVKYKIDRSHLYNSGILIKPKLSFVYTEFISSGSNAEGSVNAGGKMASFTDLIEELINDDDRLNLVANTIAEYWEKYKSRNGCFLVLSERVDYAETVCAAVEKLIPKAIVAVIHSKVPKKRQTEILEGMRRKQINILFATKLAKEGLDIPHITHGFKITPVKGDAQKLKGEDQRADGSGLEQEIGRIQRQDKQNPDKINIAEWVDFVDYNDGILKAQYYTRRKVYERLDLVMPKKSRIKSAEDKLSFLEGMGF